MFGRVIKENNKFLSSYDGIAMKIEMDESFGYHLKSGDPNQILGWPKGYLDDTDGA